MTDLMLVLVFIGSKVRVEEHKIASFEAYTECTAAADRLKVEKNLTGTAYCRRRQ
jgi:hypothetical protein